MMKKVMLCASAMLLEALVLENINVEGMRQDDLSDGMNGRENQNQRETGTAPAVQEAATKKVSTPDSHSMFLISKYFNGIKDYINIEKCCKEYRGIIEQYHFNPISFQNKKERKLFKNIETYHFYGKNSEEKKLIKNDKRIKKSVY